VRGDDDPGGPGDLHERGREGMPLGRRLGPRSGWLGRRRGRRSPLGGRGRAHHDHVTAALALHLEGATGQLASDGVGTATALAGETHEIPPTTASYWESARGANSRPWTPCTLLGLAGPLDLW